jgi:23S rRNA pseudouridine1911/1915/1917 synthase
MAFVRLKCGNQPPPPLMRFFMFFHHCWPVFYEDNHLLVLYKPAGLIMQRDHKNKANLLDLARLWIKERKRKPGNVYIGMVHRLDAPVAGVVVLARTSKAAARLSDQFRRGSIEKQYLAVVKGRPPKAADRLDNLMVRSGRLSSIAHRPAPGVQQAALRYRFVHTLEDKSLLTVTLETGRRHQIRLQLSHLGCPILGDIHYGAVSALPHGRIALLAREIALDHPTVQTRLHFESPLPTGWPWPSGAKEDIGIRPHWSIESYAEDGLVLPGASSPV